MLGTVTNRLNGFATDRVPIAGTTLLVAVAYGYFTLPNKAKKGGHKEAMSNAEAKSPK